MHRKLIQRANQNLERDLAILAQKVSQLEALFQR